MNPDSYSPGQTWVVKVGSSLLMGDDASAVTQRWVDDIAALSAAGQRIVLVSSGAVASGMKRLGVSTRPSSLHRLQATAAIGQMGLIQMYETAFQVHGMHTAQVLLTHDDLRSRQRYLNAKSTLRELLDMSVVPIINENDTVVTDEIQFGDNDTLAALVANLVDAETLVLLTDQQGLYTANPAESSDAELVERRVADDPELDDMAGEGSAIGRGGMVTKIRAARIAARSGAHTVIASGREASVLARLAKGEITGTLLTADRGMVVAKKQWLATLPVNGFLTLDDGACEVLKNAGRSLLAVGVVTSEGAFQRGEMVACLDKQGQEIARGLVNYNHDEVAQIAGRASEQIASILGYVAEPELIHRDSLVLS